MVVKIRAYFRRLVRIGVGLLVAAFSLCGAAAGQAPEVTTGSIITIPSNNNFGQIYKILFYKGNVVAFDAGTDALYQLSPGATSWTTLVAPGTTLGSAGGFSSEGMCMDAQGTLYIGIRYSLTSVPNAMFFRVPYDPTTNSWEPTTSDGWGSNIMDPSTGSALVIETGVDDAEFLNSPKMDGSGTLYFTSEAVNNLYSVPVDSQGNSDMSSVNVNALVTGMKNDAATFKVDPNGNIFLVERHDAKASAEVIGLFFISESTLAGGITGTGVGDAETQFQRIDSTTNTVKYAGVTLDAFGNLYMDSENNASYAETMSGIWEIPNACGPTGVKPDVSNISTCYDFSNLSYLGPIDGNQPLSIDSRGYLWIPSYQKYSPSGSGEYPSNYAIVVWAPGSLNLGAVPVGVAGGPLGPVCADGSTPSTTTGLCANGDPPVSAGLLFVNFNQPVSSLAINFSQPGNGTDFQADLLTNPLPPGSGTTSAVPCTALPVTTPPTTTEPVYSALSTCLYWVELDARAPGPISGQLTMQGMVGSSTTSTPIPGGTTYLSGTGEGPEASLLSTPAETAVAAGLDTPAQVASDAAGDTYVADPGRHKVLYFTANSSNASGASVGKNLVNPTGVAVDGSGDVYIADSGNVYEIPWVNGALNTAGQTTIATGLGNSGLNLAVDGVGNVYVADPENARVVKIPNPDATYLVTSPTTSTPLPSSLSTTITVGSGFSKPTAVAVDSNSEDLVCSGPPPTPPALCTPIPVPAGSNDLFVADGTSLYEITPWNVQTELTSSLAGSITGLAVDASGSVIVAQSGGILRIPSIDGTLTVNSAGPLEDSVFTPTGTTSILAPNSVALDQQGNLYVTDMTDGTPNLFEFNVNGFVNFGQGLTPTVLAEEDVPVFNNGNQPLNVTGATFSGPDATNGDFSLVAPSGGTPCDITGTTPVTTGSSCTWGVGFTPPAPPAGDINPITYSGDTLSVQTNASNVASGTVTAGLQGTALAGLEATQTSVTLNPPGSVFPGSTTATVTITPEPGNGIDYVNSVPSGPVTLTLSPAAPGSNQQAITQTAQATGNTTGTTATFTLTSIPGGTYNVTAVYGGNLAQLFQKSSSSPVTFIVATAAPVITLPEPNGVQPNSSNGVYYVGTSTTTDVTANVSSTLGVPTGTVTFMNGTAAVGTATLDANGNATINAGALPAGVYNLTAVYSGDENFSSLTSAAISFQVIPQSVLISASPTSVTTTAGTPVASTLTLSSLVGFSAPNGTNITCVDNSSMPKDAECTFSVPQPDLCAPTSGSGNTCQPTTTVVTVSTNIPVNVGSLERERSRTSPLALAGLFGLGLLGLALRRRRLFNRYFLGAGCLVLFLAASVMDITSCTNSSYTHTPAVPKYTTPSGTYNVSIVVTNPSTGQVESLPFILSVTIQ
ncbi:MAG: Ig-like domain repeat protein [Terracidiphilus sp.]